MVASKRLDGLVKHVPSLLVSRQSRCRLDLRDAWQLRVTELKSVYPMATLLESPVNGGIHSAEEIVAPAHVASGQSRAKKVGAPGWSTPVI